MKWIVQIVAVDSDDGEQVVRELEKDNGSSLTIVDEESDWFVLDHKPDLQLIRDTARSN
jgi:hypothetical protein